MKFQKGNTFGKGGKKEGAGRPTAEQVKEKKTKEQIASRMLDRKVRRLMKKYLDVALDEDVHRSEKVLINAVDKILPAARRQIDITGDIVEHLYTNVDFDK